MVRGPQRIVCLTDEYSEILYLLGESERIVGISGFARRPEGIRAQKPIVCTFTDGDLEKIAAVEPDLILGFSDVQADLAASLIRAGHNVYISNQRTVSEILDHIELVGRLVNATDRARSLRQKLEHGIAAVQDEIAVQPAAPRPRVYIEEWYEPMVAGITWVSELAELAGAVDVFADRAKGSKAEHRVLSPDDVLQQDPDMIWAGWCGKMFKPAWMERREGWTSMRAWQNNEYYEINSDWVHQPGPAALDQGLSQLRQLVRDWQQRQR